MLLMTADLDDLDQGILDQILAMRAELQRQVQDRPQPWTAGLRKYLTADAVAASNSVEGFRVSAQDALDIAAGERDVPVSADNRAETAAYQHLMTYAQTLATAPHLSASGRLSERDPQHRADPDLDSRPISASGSAHSADHGTLITSPPPGTQKRTQVAPKR